MATTHNGFARHYRPHDIYVGNLITALGCIDAGITCVIDNSHNSRSAAHSDAAVQALIDSGHSRRARVGRAGGRRVGPAVAAGSRAAAEEVLLVDRSARDAADVRRDEPRELGVRAKARHPHHHRIECRRARVRAVPERGAGSRRQHVQPLPGVAGPGVAAGQGVRRHGERVPAVGRAVRAGRGRVRLPAGAGPRHAPGLQHRQRSVVRHRHVQRDARGVQHPARDGHNIARANGDAKAPAPVERAHGAGVRHARRRGLRRPAGLDAAR